jgi:type II secretory pathway predicted ATPase ExeA/cytochrome c-type biogenesis protein CcmH/NrfG
MYTSFYKLSVKPFKLNADPRFLWLGTKHKEALASLKYGVIGERGFLLLTGDVGTGKTTLINALLQSLDENTLVANVTDPSLDLMGFLNLIAQSFGISQRFEKKEEFLKYTRDFLKKKFSENMLVLLIIDEAHKLTKELLEEIRLISNIELPEKKLINIFFVGQNELNQTLLSRECRALRQRITLNYNIQPLSESETLEYIKYRLKIAGTEAELFNQHAIREIYHFSKGYPRLINLICDHALLTGYVGDLKNITPDIIMGCAQEILLSGESPKDSLFNFSGDADSGRTTALTRKEAVANGDTENQVSSMRQPASIHRSITSKERINIEVFVALLVILAVGFIFFDYKDKFFQSGQRMSSTQEINALVPAPRDPNRATLSQAHQEIKDETSRNNAFPELAAKKAPTLPSKPKTVEPISQTKPSHLITLAQATEALKKKNFDRAIQLYEDALAHQPVKRPEVKARYVQALRGQAGMLLEKDSKQSEILLHKAIEVDPQNAQTHYELGKLYTRSKDYPKAISAYQKAADLNPRSANTLFNLGFVYATTKDTVRAEEMFLRVVKLKPPYQDRAIFNLAMVQQKQGKNRECIANLEKVLKINPQNKKARKYLKRLKGNSGE